MSSDLQLAHMWYAINARYELQPSFALQCGRRVEARQRQGRLFAAAGIWRPHR